MALQAATDFASSQLGPTLFQYAITLRNTGTTTIGSLWFAWDDFPDQNFMPTPPGSITSPPGWTAIVTHNGPSDGYGIEWVANSPAARLAPDATLAGFGFQSATTPAVMEGKSPIDAAFDTTSSFVYVATPLSDPGYLFTADAPAGPVGIAATTDLTSSQLAPALFQYAITLNNTGTTTIGSFWFAWDDLPDQNFMPTPPGAIQAPPGWIALTTHNGPSDGYGIEWVATSPAAFLATGGTLAGFAFQSATTPAQMQGKSPIDPDFDTTSSFVYIAAPEADPGYLFTAAGTSSGGLQGLHAETDFAGTQVQPGLFEYTITLRNTGTTTVGTLWFAWDDLPDQNFMAVAPSTILTPPGWTASITHNGPTDGYGIEWIATSPASRLAAGSSLAGFSFRSSLPPAAFNAASPIDPSFQVTSSFVYEGPPLVGDGYLFNVACFRQGTRLRTPTGWRAVEDLAVGDPVTLHGGGTAPVKWLGWRRIDCRRHPRPELVWPIRIAPDALGPGRPRAPLHLSPDHAIYHRGRLVPAYKLVNGATITQEPTDEITYWHVELPQHAVLLAEGLPAESYLDTGNRTAFANAEGAVQLHPSFGPADSRAIWQSQGCAPLLEDGPELARLRARLLARAQSLGHTLTDDPALVITVDGAPATLHTTRQRVIVTLPPGARTLRLRSRHWIPGHTTPHGEDPRRLGIAIAAPRLDLRPMALADPRLATGWHPAETDLRWTDGDATLDVTGARRVDFDLAMIGRYWAPSREEPPRREQRR